MITFSFTPCTEFDDETGVVSITLEPSFNEEPLSRPQIDKLLLTSDYNIFFILEDGVEELLVTDDSFREQGQKILDVYLQKLKNSKDSAKDNDTSDEPPEDLTPQQIFALLHQEKPSLNVAERRDGIAELSTSDDDLKAFLNVSKAYGGETITCTDVHNKIEQLGIQAKIDQSAIETTVKEALCKPIVISRGEKPVKGRNSTFEPLVTDQLSLGPKIDDKGIANYHDINIFAVVEQGDALVRRIPPTAGKNGVDVFGKIIPAVPGEVLPFDPNLSGAQTRDDDIDILEATIKGHPVIHPMGASVDAVLVLKSINLATGNIDYDGSVCIEEDVADGMSVKATGDVTVKGVVGRANIESEGSILISQGLIGGSTKQSDKTSGKSEFGAFLKAKADVSAKFASAARIISGNDINIAEYANYCDLHASKTIRVGHPFGKGHLNGGHAYAFDGINTKVLGSTGSTHTNIKVGAGAENVVNLKDITVKVLKKQSKAQSIHDSLRKLLIKVKVIGPSPQLKEMIEGMNEELQKLNEEITEYQVLQKEIQHVLIKTKKSRVVCRQKIFQNVFVSILGSSYKSKEEMPGMSFYFDAKKIRTKPN